jgi:hypothetical protein
MIGPTNGTIQVFRINTIFNTITWQRMIDATDFAVCAENSTDNKINDFEILPAAGNTSRLMLLVTIDGTGLAYGFFDSTDAAILDLTPRNSLNIW